MNHRAGWVAAVAFVVGVGVAGPCDAGGLGALKDNGAPPHGAAVGAPDGTPATVDRVDAGLARVLVGDYPPQVHTIDAERLPRGAGEGTALRIQGALTDGLRHARLVLDPEATARRQERVRSKLQRLRSGRD